MKGLGWIRDSLDPRDYQLGLASPGEIAALPSKVDLRPNLPVPCYDQNFQDCTANAWAAAVQYAGLKELEKYDSQMPSRLLIYYGERRLEGMVKSDAGAQIRDGAKALSQWGTVLETEWAYVKRNLFTMPTQAVYKDAALHKSIQSLRVAQDANQMKAALTVYPIVIGIAVYQSFEAIGKSGVGEMPVQGDQFLGGHALLLMGYETIAGKPYWIIRNSWGQWGDNGYCYLPQQYLTDTQLAADFWTLRSIA